MHELQYSDDVEQGGVNRTRDASPEMAMMQSYKNNTALAGADTKNGIPTMKRSVNNNPLALSADFNNASLKGLGNSGSGTNFNFKLPAMNIGGPKDSQNYNNMTRNS